MEWKNDTAADIVIGHAAKVAEDMVQGTAAAIEEIVRFNAMYKGMAESLEKAANNLRKHMLQKKWVGDDGKKELRHRLSQIKAISKICKRMQMWCNGFANGSINELKKMEASKKLTDIVNLIETGLENDSENND